VLADAGLGVLGALSPARYDALVPLAWQLPAALPAARTAIVVASGGCALWDAIARGAVPRPGGSDPVDHHTREALLRALETLEADGHPSRALFAFETLGGVYADFVALARAAGLGAPSRLGLLLHPEFGPWFSIRALILTPLALPETPFAPGFDPCTGCPAPCQSTCPTAAPGLQGFDLAACDRGRAAHSACRAACAARRACPIGAEHAYPREAEAHHMRFR
jgi:hypothetical protein